MHSTFLEDADPSAVSHAVRAVLEGRGALVREHVSTRVRFQTQPSKWDWLRSGYVGIYQHLGEKDVELRVLIRARTPHMLFWMTGVVVLLACLATIVLNPPGTTWFVVSFLCGLALLVTTLVYVNTWRPVAEEERGLVAALEAKLQDEHVGALEREDERELHDLEAALEGEVERRRFEQETRLAKKEEKDAKRDEKAARKDAPKEARPKPKFNLTLPKLGKKKD